MGFFKEFMDFMKEQKILAVALAFIVGVATAALVNAFVTDIIAPIYSPYTNFLDPEQTVKVGLSEFKVGHFIREAINWIVIMLVVFIIGKKLVKM